MGCWLNVEVEERGEKREGRWTEAYSPLMHKNQENL